MTRRVVEGYEWSTSTGFVQEVVEAELAVELLTEPSGAFVIDQDDAVMQLHGIGPQRVAEMALAGIATLADLAALDETGIVRLDRAIWASGKQIRAWVKQARSSLSIEQEQEVEA